MRKVIIISFLFYFFFISCKEKNTKTIFKKFPTEFNLEGIRTGTKTEFNLAKLDIYDSILIITTTNKKKLLHLYSLNSFNHIISSIKVGNGPNEIKNPGFSVFERKNGIVWLNDLGKQVVIGYDINNILKNKNCSQRYNIKPPGSIYPANYFIPIDENMFLYPARNPDYYFYCANNKGIIIDSFNIQNKTNIYPNINKMDLYYAVWYHCAIHPRNNKMFIAYMFADIIVGIDLKGRVLYLIQGPDIIQEDPKKIRNPYVKETYIELKSDNQYIYCLYLGESISFKSNEEYEVNHPKTILVFNWDGEPIARINLDYSILDFSIDSKNQRIITYSADLGELVYYNIPKGLYKKFNNNKKELQ